MIRLRDFGLAAFGMLIAFGAQVAVGQTPNIPDDELQSAMAACREHPGSADVGGGFSRPGSNGFAKGYEVCADILARWKVTERAKREQEAIDKKAAGEAAIKSIQQKLGK